ncbi:peptidylprolyl isomerase [Rhodoferax sp. WC2427]|uniref:peptidylprolyl isomerase n=1 Tax=Rhodoferax sp. WC2427 TaxID=3234144 RepID=UPI003465FA69
MSNRFFRKTLLGLAALAALTASAQGLRPSTGAGTGLTGNIPARTSDAQRQADFIVAVVNSEPITNNEVRARVIRTLQQMAQQGTPAGEADQAVVVRQVLDRLILEKAQLQLAAETGLKIDDATVDAAELNVARQNQLDVPELRRRMVQDGMVPAQFREELRNQLILTRLRDREIDARQRVSDADVDQYLRDQQANTDPSALELNLAMVLVAVPENASPEQVATLQAKAESLRARAAAGADFAGLARTSSDAPDHARGGAMGMRPADRYPDVFVEATRGLDTGGVSAVVRSGAGFHILKVLDKRQGGLATTVVQQHARHILLRTGPRLTESAAVERMNDFKRRIQSGQADFAQLAKENSTDGSAAQGGDLGWSSPGQFVPEFEEALDKLEPGQIADPLVSRFGVHLVQLLERREAAVTPKEQREIARGIVREKKLDEAYARWLEQVRSRAYVEFREPPQ